MNVFFFGEVFQPDKRKNHHKTPNSAVSKHICGNRVFEVRACVFQVMCTRGQWTGSCGGSALMTASPSSHRWDRIYQNVVCILFSHVCLFFCFFRDPSSFHPALSFTLSYTSPDIDLTSRSFFCCLDLPGLLKKILKAHFLHNISSSFSFLAVFW